MEERKIDLNFDWIIYSATGEAKSKASVAIIEFLENVYLKNTDFRATNEWCKVIASGNPISISEAQWVDFRDCFVEFGNKILNPLIVNRMLDYLLEVDEKTRSNEESQSETD